MISRDSRGHASLEHFVLALVACLAGASAVAAGSVSKGRMLASPDDIGPIAALATNGPDVVVRQAKNALCGEGYWAVAECILKGVKRGAREQVGKRWEDVKRAPDAIASLPTAVRRVIARAYEAPFETLRQGASLAVGVGVTIVMSPVLTAVEVFEAYEDARTTGDYERVGMALGRRGVDHAAEAIALGAVSGVVYKYRHKVARLIDYVPFLRGTKHERRLRSRARDLHAHGLPPGAGFREFVDAQRAREGERAVNVAAWRSRLGNLRAYLGAGIGRRKPSEVSVPLHPDDAADLLRFAKDAQDTGYFGPTTWRRMANREANRIRGRSAVLMHYRNGEPVGALAFHPGGGKGEPLTIVHIDARTPAVAESLVLRAVAEKMERGYEGGLFAEVRPGLVYGRQFFEDLGFLHVRSMKERAGPGRDRRVDMMRLGEDVAQRLVGDK